MARSSIGPGRHQPQREPDEIVVEGAREHNLKVERLAIPKHQLVVITGPSGSGKSSLAFDTLYAEGQRRYVESLSAYARQFLGQMEKPKYERLRGLSPTIAIQQKSASSNPRSTVGTVTEIYDYLRVLFARVGDQRCHQCGDPVSKRSAAEIVDELAALPDKTQVTVYAPKAENRKGEFRDLLADARKAGFVRVRIDGMVVRLEDVEALDKQKRHAIELVIDRLSINAADRGRLTDSVETALREGKGKLMIEVAGERTPRVYSEDNACARCGLGFPELSPQSFSFNSPLGMCVTCNGLGEKLQADPELIVPDPTRSIRDGAVAVWGDSMAKDSGWTANIVKALAKAFKIDLDKPWGKLPPKQRELLMHGTGDKRVTVAWEGKHSTGEWAMRFEGILSQLERRHRESSSDRTRAHYEQYFRAIACADCHGSRLRPESRAVVIAGQPIIAVTGMTVRATHQFVTGLTLRGSKAQIAGEVLKEISARLTFLLDVGLDYLTLDRGAGTLSGGEAQRIRLASQLGSELSGVLYVLDEPSIGLHQRDNERLIRTLHRLRDLGNSVLVVEHDEATIEAADWVIDFGPGAGRHGGMVVAEGVPDDVRANPKSPTGRFMAGVDRIDVPAQRRAAKGWIELTGAREHNLRDVDVRIPLGVMVAVTGVSGAGKSSLINATLHPALARTLHGSLDRVGPHKALTGLDQIDKVIVIDQQPIGRTPRSNPATYTKAFDLIRELYAQTQTAKTYGYAAGRFSFNVSAKQGGGRCEACEGAGMREVEMHFLPNVFVTCEVCRGKRYNDATLRVTYKDKTIAQILDTPIDEALELFRHHKQLSRIMQTMVDVGLGYLSLGQPATTLSGGEAQRVKLARELSRVQTGRTLYLLDEPTTGLHFGDVQKLLEVLGRLVDSGNTVLVIEHNLDVVKTADWVIDLGPEGGAGGGQIIAAGTPEDVAAVPASFTGQFLVPLLRRARAGAKPTSTPPPRPSRGGRPAASA
ncbi:MAG: excinuclease ABC subunit UvrA [Kofleriaceae bacterium]|nr:excinuclease ABC subunit UvrA [Kofleriaceae bacterium]MBP6837221.1 excinuclease ABC subunit UvrA [Kofleriaceae bacterium]